MIAQILKSKTMLFAILLAILGTLQASMEVFTPYLTAQAAGFITLAVSLAVAVLRVLTTMPLDDK